MKEESEKVGLKLNIQKTKIMASGPITSWQTDEETVETVADYFFGLQNHCRWWPQPWNLKMLAPWKKSYDQLSILKSKDIILPTKVHLVKAMVFSLIMYWCESWTLYSWALKINAFELWCWRRLLSLLDCKEIQPVQPKGNQSWIFIGRTDAEAEAPILQAWCEELTHWKRPWCWERLKAGREGDDRGWDGWMASPTQWTWVWVTYGSWWWTGKPSMLQSMGSHKRWTQLSDWTVLKSLNRVSQPLSVIFTWYVSTHYMA